MTDISSLTFTDLETYIKSLGEPAFRAKQIYAWLSRGVMTFDGMTDISKALREKLHENCTLATLEMRRRLVDPEDGTAKYLFALSDGLLIETVVMKYKHGNSVCISSQAGCRMGCRFCASTLLGKERDLTAGEILGQVVAANNHIRKEDPERRIHNIVLMGSGEPFDNYDNVVKFLRLVNDPKGLNISLRNISLSTCGLVPKMRAFADEGLPVTLSISLHAPNDGIRQKIMPVAHAYAIEDVLSACRNYVEKTGRRVVFEYALIKNVNCDVKCAEELARRLRGLQCHVNLIPLNAVKERNLEAPTKQDVQAFLKRLELKNISATMRREMGADIDGACGQLRRKALTEGI